MMWVIVRRHHGLSWGGATHLDHEPTPKDIESFASRCGPIDGKVNIEVFKVEPAGRYTAVEKSSFDVTREDA
jgi:hypothetical protein